MKRNYKIMFINRPLIVKKILLNTVYIATLLIFVLISKITVKNLQDIFNKDLGNNTHSGMTGFDENKQNTLEFSINTIICGTTMFVDFSIIVFETIFISSNCYDMGWDVFSKEISSGSYTSTSLYFAYFASVSIFTFAVNSLMAFLQYIVQNRFLAGTTLKMYSFSVSVAIIFGLFIAALSKTKMVHSFLSGVVILSLFSDGIIFDKCKLLIAHIVSNEKVVKVFNTVIETVLTITPCFICKRIFSGLSDKIIYKNIKNVENIKDAQKIIYFINILSNGKHFLDSMELDLIKWSVLFICNMVLWMLLTLFISGKILGSNNRLRLQKKI